MVGLSRAFQTPGTPITLEEMDRVIRKRAHSRCMLCPRGIHYLKTLNPPCENSEDTPRFRRIFGVMFQREINLPESRSFFLFGARGTGKSTLAHQTFPSSQTHFIDLLSVTEEDRYARDPDLLYREALQLPEAVRTIVIDEVQKLPRLLDVVHKLIFETELQFVLTGSSARKLRSGAANMLAGRAFVRNLHPLTSSELGDRFALGEILSWGSLPEIFSLQGDDRAEYLKAYARTYLKEEVWAEHLVRRLDPFRKFLEVAAQHNGQKLNFSAIARDVGVDDKTVKEYFQILEDTLLGFFLEPYLRSERKRVAKAPKFYFFDLGVGRALCNMLTISVQEGTSYFGDLFEAFFILEMLRREAYFPRDYRFYYLATERREVDLVVERPGKPLALVEIKSAQEVQPHKLRGLTALGKDFPEAELFWVSRDPKPQSLGRVQALPWKRALEVV